MHTKIMAWWLLQKSASEYASQKPWGQTIYEIVFWLSPPNQCCTYRLIKTVILFKSIHLFWNSTIEWYIVEQSKESQKCLENFMKIKIWLHKHFNPSTSPVSCGSSTKMIISMRTTNHTIRIYMKVPMCNSNIWTM